MNSPHKDQWHGALLFSLICAWINGWVNDRKAGDLRRHRVQYEVTVKDTSSTSVDSWAEWRLGGVQILNEFL